MVVPIRGFLDSMRRLMKEELYVRRGSTQQDLGKSRFFNDFKVAEHRRGKAIPKFSETLGTDEELRAEIWFLSR